MNQDKKEITERTGATARYNPRAERVLTPAADIFESEDSAVLLVELPGVEQSNLDIQVERGALSISGRSNGGLRPEVELRRREFGDCVYRRSFALSDELDLDAVQASLKDGLLRITLSRSERTKARKIPIRSV